VGLFGRLSGKIKAGLNAALAPAADPRQTYLNAYQKQRLLLSQVEGALDQVVASKKRLQDKTQEVRAKLPALQDQARDALKAGREDMARIALQRRQVAIMELKTLEEQVVGVEKEEASLSMIEQRLATQVEAFAARQDVIMARYSAAEAQVRINEAVTGVSQEFAELAAALEQAEEKTQNMQARASAIDRLVQEGVLDAGTMTDSLATMDAHLELAGVNEAVDEQLAALAQEVHRQLPGPS
jgi:phage shock protein A